MDDHTNNEAAAANHEGGLADDHDALRRRTRRRLVIYVVVFFLFLLLVIRPEITAAGWGGDFGAAMTKAKKTGRPVVVAFHGKYCPPCHVMERTVLGKPAVQKALEDFVPVRLDPEDHPDVAQRYQIQATPTYLVLTPDGTPVNVLVGAQSVEEFVSFLHLSAGLAADTPPEPKVDPNAKPATSAPTEMKSTPPADAQSGAAASAPAGTKTVAPTAPDTNAPAEMNAAPTTAPKTDTPGEPG